MAWERGYYYRKRRIGGQVVSEYIGTGPLAELIAEEDEQQRAEREAQRAQLRKLKRADRNIDRQIDEAGEMVRSVINALLLATGHHTHKRQWRQYGNN